MTDIPLARECGAMLLDTKHDGPADQVLFTEAQLTEFARRIREEAQQDTKRIDWLADPSQTIGNVQLPAECVTRNLHSLRDAIDDAMRLDAIRAAAGRKLPYDANDEDPHVMSALNDGWTRKEKPDAD